MRQHKRIGLIVRSETLEPRLLLATVSGVKFHDLDSDGVRDPGEPGLGAWTIYQDVNNNDLFDGADRSDVTDATTGAYTIELFPIIFGPQQARIREVLRPGWRQTSPAGGEHTFVYSSSRDEFTGLNFGNYLEAVAPSAAVAVQRALGIRVMFTDNSTGETQFIIQRKLAAEPDTAFAEVGRAPGSAPGVRQRMGFTGLGGVPGQTYHYRVLADTPYGVSPPSNIAAITVGNIPDGTGARVTWYNDRFFTGEPLTLDAPADADQYFDLGTPDPRIDPETFSGVFSALLEPEFTEPYTFYSASDDGIDLTIVDPATGQILLNGPPDGINVLRPMDPVAGFQDTLGTITLQASIPYLVRWRLSENMFNAGYRVGWSSLSVAQEVLPTELMIPTMLTPGYLRTMQCGDEVVLTFLDLTVSEGGTQVQRATSPDGPYDTIATIVAPGTAAYRSFVDEGAAPYPLTIGQTYYYRLRSTMYGAAGQPSAPVAVTLEADPTDLALGGHAVYLPGPDGDPSTAADNILRLTDLADFQLGGAFTTQGWDLIQPSRGTGGRDGFSASFTFTMPRRSTTPGDGFAFVLQRNSPTAIGLVGNGLGYERITNSLAVKFDLYPNINRTGVFANGFMDDSGTNVPFVFSNGDSYRVDLSYDAGGNSLFQRITNLTTAAPPFEVTHTTAIFAAGGTVPLDLSQVLGNDCAYVGFTGATGAALAEQQITSFSINGTAIPFRTPPASVRQVYVAGSAWGASFKQHLQSTSAGSSRFGFALPAGAAGLDELPWVNLNQVSITFDRDPEAAPGDLEIRGVRTSSYPLDPASFSYDAASKTATWALVPGTTFSNDRILLDLDLEHGNDVQVRFNVLPGDADRSGTVLANDFSQVKQRFFANTTSPNYSLFHDVNGSGSILADDFSQVKQRFFDSLPAGEPSVTGTLFTPASLLVRRDEVR